MATVQSTYSELQPIGQAGMPASGDFSADTRNCETTAGIGFGVAVSQGAADLGAVIGGASAAVFVGVTIADKSVPYNGTADGYARYDSMGVMTRGQIWVVTGGIVAAGGDVTFAATTGVLSSAATGGSQFAIAHARWMTGAASGGIALLQLGGALPSV
jgi:hypothetical protein